MAEAQVGWVGAGRMGVPMVSRLLRAGTPVRVWNRTAEKVQPLVAQGAQPARALAELGTLPVVFTMLENDAAVREVVEQCLLPTDPHPRVVVDCSTISVELAAELEAAAGAAGVSVLHSPVLGNPHHVASGELATICSGPAEVFDEVRPLLAQIAGHVTYAGAGLAARVAKICANILVGATAETLAELLLVGESHGVARGPMMDFLNHSVMGSNWIDAKTKAFVQLDFDAAFTAEGMRKDLYLAQRLAREHYLSAPIVDVVAAQLTRLVGRGTGAGKDFSSVLQLLADDAGHRLDTGEDQMPAGPDGDAW